jgi:hypothetical protein
MTDITKRLRQAGGSSWAAPMKIREEAANEIERLRFQQKRYVTANQRMRDQEPVGEVVMEMAGCSPVALWGAGEYPRVGTKLYAAPVPSRDDEALLRQALEAMEHAISDAADYQAINVDQIDAAITAIKERLG